ncbi:efflux RND transporter periplasmic adaptor subunit [Singulisphaera acidiphila]|uniref:RND family efflux transporter, MFP subunit n=2 Tax=Singulisphaera acidiphila TaxID=466153 RepID=L0DGX7_SINAD|nr:efflux RND transporter periplasmic adaptor subunit [Singulisphaera acidiphila]AGA28073.1 RND family efflux transporter, MFP subunit [Singulisphaera acidiphila DSM 18658]
MNANPPDPAPTEPSPFFAPKSTKRRNSTLGIVGLVVTTAAAFTGRWLLATAAAAHAPKAVEPLPVSVRVLPVVEEVVSSGLRYSGVAKELRKAELSFRVSGTVASLHQVTAPGGRMRDVHEGDRLAKGTVIARLDPDDYGRERGQAAERLATARARLAQAKANSEQAQIDLRRNEQLARRNSLSVAELDNARTNLKAMTATEEAAEGDVALARIGLEQAEANLQYCSLTVPFEESTVAVRAIDANGRVTPNQRTFTIVDISSVVIAFNVPDTLVGRLAIGQKVEVATDALTGQRFVGVMHKIASSADERTRTYPIEVRVDNPQGLRPGMVATVLFRKETRAYLLPLTSVAAGPSAQTLMVYRVEDEGGKPVVREVSMAFDDVLDNKVAIRMGNDDRLRPGDRVVATGVHRLRDGQAVRIVE